MAVANEEFGSLLRRFRRDAGLTQSELAERSGLSARGISDLERGARERPHRDTVEMLAGALGLAEDERARLKASARARALDPLARRRGVGMGSPNAAQSAHRPRRGTQRDRSAC